MPSTALAWSRAPSMFANTSALLSNRSERISYFFPTCLPNFHHDGPCLLTFEHTGSTPASGPLHWLFPAPGMLFPDSCMGDCSYISPLSQAVPTLIHTLTTFPLLASPLQHRSASNILWSLLSCYVLLFLFCLYFTTSSHLKASLLRAGIPLCFVHWKYIVGFK